MMCNILRSKGDLFVCLTIHDQPRRVRRDSGLVLRVTRIESGVMSGHGLNGEHIDPLPDPREGNVMKTINGGVIQQPGDIHGQVSTQNCALY